MLLLFSHYLTRERAKTWIPQVNEKLFIAALVYYIILLFMYVFVWTLWIKIILFCGVSGRCLVLLLSAKQKKRFRLICIQMIRYRNKSSSEIPTRMLCFLSMSCLPSLFPICFAYFPRVLLLLSLVIMVGCVKTLAPLLVRHLQI